VSAQLGASFHEQHRLLNFIRSQNTDGKIVTPSQDISRIRNTIHSDDTAKEMLADLNDSIAVFVGTKQTIKKITNSLSAEMAPTQESQTIFFVIIVQKNTMLSRKNFRGYLAPHQKMLPRSGARLMVMIQMLLRKLEARRFFYDNHLNQLRSYLFGIKDYQISYGYVVYWRYSYEHNSDKNKKDEYTPQMEQSDLER
jgi:hypothetical protein